MASDFHQTDWIINVGYLARSTMEEDAQRSVGGGGPSLHHTTLTPSQYIWMLCLDRFLSFSSKTSQRWLRHGQFDANNSMRRLFQRHSVFALLALMSLCSVSNAAFCPSASCIWTEDDGPLHWLDKLYLSLHLANSFSISNRFWPRFICNLNYSCRFPKIIQTYSQKKVERNNDHCLGFAVSRI